MLFSQRYFRAIENNMLVVNIADAARRRLWAWDKVLRLLKSHPPMAISLSK